MKGLYNIVLLPPVDAQEKTIKLSNLISEEFETFFILDGKNYFPHLTLFQLAVPGTNLVSLKKELKIIFTEAINAKFNKYFGAENGFLSWDCENDSSLSNLHQIVIKTANKFRKKQKLPSSKLHYDFLTKKDLEQISTYGSSGLLENFRPHITITRLKNGRNYKRVLKILPTEETEIIKFETAALGELSTHGTVVELIEKYNLN